MHSALLDLHYALRGLLRAPMFALAVICSLAVGIGANTAVFSVFNSVLLRPFPYPDPDALISLYETSPARGILRFTVSPPDFLNWRASARTLEGLAAYRDWTPTLTGIGDAERVRGLRVSGDFFRILGVLPLSGRTLTTDDEAASGRTVVISQSLWSRIFGADAGLIGRSLRLDGESFVVAGIVPSSLQFPGRDIDIWAPLDLSREQNDRDEHSLLVVARLKSGVSLEQARAEVRALAVQHQVESGGHTPEVARLRDWFVVPGSRRMLWFLLGAVGLLLIAACANVANLLLARGKARAHEMAVRTAIGATRRRLIAQLFTESLLLAAIGGVSGLMLAMWSVRALTAMLPESSTFFTAPIALDWRVLTYTIGISIVAGILFGILPALKYSRAEITTIKATLASPSLRLRGTLLVAQTALAVTLIAAAGLLTKGFMQIWRIDGGFAPGGVMSGRVTLTTARPGADHVAFFERIIDQLTADPQIASAAAVTFLPLSGRGSSGYITLEDRQSLSESPDTRPGAARLIVAGAYFQALGIPLREGRVFSTSDDGAALPVVIVNETLARLYWPDQSPIGRRIKRGTPAAPFRWLTIVGVVGDVRQLGLGAQAGPTIYLPLAQSAEPSMTIFVKSDLPDAAAAARIRSAVRSVDRNQPLESIRSLDDILFGSISGRWVPTIWMGIFAGLAMVLAALGVYGVVIYAVEQRRREFGVRLALGADRSNIIRLASRHGMIPTFAGTILGAGAAFVLARFNSAVFVGVEPLDIPMFAASAILLAAIAYTASYFPARRIADEDAVLALRAE